jgi:SAM-dependent methyltransferase
MSAPTRFPDWIAYEPDLVPPPALMSTEGITVLEEWYRWGEEWAVLLRALAGLRRETAILEIGCGLGRIAFALRYLVDQGSYHGFEIVRPKVEFLDRSFPARHPNFHFTWANVHNTHYNPGGVEQAASYTFPYDDSRFDIVFAASVFTHMAPINTARYFRESARVLKPGGRCLFSFFLLDHYRPIERRAAGFDRPDFDLVHPFPDYPGCAAAFPDDPERMTGYRVSYLQELAGQAGLTLVLPVFPGYWSGASHYFGAQDLVLLTR